MRIPGLFFFMIISVLLTHSAAHSANPIKVPPTNYFIIVTGGELLEGVYPDAHTSFITRSLLPLGLRCIGSLIVDDNRHDLLDALSYATNKSSLIIVTGGLGPTANDITRETLSEFTKIELSEHPELIKQMEKRFNTSKENLRANLIKQTQVPVKGGYLKNSGGTAAGLIFEASQFEMIALPGPPRELRQMVKDELLPYLNSKYGIRAPKHVATARFIGIGQSQIDDTLKNVIKISSDIVMTSLFEGGRVDFFFSLKDDIPQNQERLNDLIKKLKDHFGEAIYSTDEHSLEDVVAQKLESNAVSVVIADASGGYFLRKIQESEHFRNILSISLSASPCYKLARYINVEKSQWDKLKTVHEQVEFIAERLSLNNEKILAICIGEPVRTTQGFTISIVCKMKNSYTDAFDVNLYDTTDSSFFNLTSQILDRLRRRLK